VLVPLPSPSAEPNLAHPQFHLLHFLEVPDEEVLLEVEVEVLLDE